MSEELQCKIYPLKTLTDLKFVIICSLFRGKFLLSRHKQRSTWETQGGHIEPGENALEAAKRELYEESGVQKATLHYVCDYLGYNSTGSAGGAVFFADIHELGSLPDSEMAETKLFDELPKELTYKIVTPKVFTETISYAKNKNII